jgi:hypothetical protein
LAAFTTCFWGGVGSVRIPFAASFAPVGAAMLTALAGAVANVFRQGSGG